MDSQKPNDWPLFGRVMQVDDLIADGCAVLTRDAVKVNRVVAGLILNRPASEPIAAIFETLKVFDVEEHRRKAVNTMDRYGVPFIREIAPFFKSNCKSDRIYVSTDGIAFGNPIDMAALGRRFSARYGIVDETAIFTAADVKVLQERAQVDTDQPIVVQSSEVSDVADIPIHVRYPFNKLFLDDFAKLFNQFGVKAAEERCQEHHTVMDSPPCQHVAARDTPESRDYRLGVQNENARVLRVIDSLEDEFYGRHPRFLTDVHFKYFITGLKAAFRDWKAGTDAV